MGFVVQSSATQTSASTGNVASPDVVFADVVTSASSLSQTLGELTEVENVSDLLGFEAGQSVTLAEFVAAVQASGNDSLPVGFAYTAWNLNLENDVRGTDDVFGFFGVESPEGFAGSELTLDQFQTAFVDSGLSITGDQFAQAFNSIDA